MILISSGTGYIEFFLPAAAEGKSQRELTIVLWFLVDCVQILRAIT